MCYKNKLNYDRKNGKAEKVFFKEFPNYVKHILNNNTYNAGLDKHSFYH